MIQKPSRGNRLMEVCCFVRCEHRATQRVAQGETGRNQTGKDLPAWVKAIVGDSMGSATNAGAVEATKGGLKSV